MVAVVCLRPFESFVGYSGFLWRRRTTVFVRYANEPVLGLVVRGGEETVAEMLVRVAGGGIMVSQRSRLDWTRKVEALDHPRLKFELCSDKLDVLWTERLGAIVTEVFA